MGRSKGTMHGPLADQYDGDGVDQELVCAALEGRGDALDILVRRHQGFIYDIVILRARKAYSPEQADPFCS